MKTLSNFMETRRLGGTLRSFEVLNFSCDDIEVLGGTLQKLFKVAVMAMHMYIYIERERPYDNSFLALAVQPFLKRSEAGRRDTADQREGSWRKENPE